MAKIDEPDSAAYAGAAMAPQKKKAAKKFSEMIAIRVLPEDYERLDVLAERLPFVSRHALARAALKIGLSALEDDPKRLLDEEMVKTPARKRPATARRG
jgi:hypothetical protein